MTAALLAGVILTARVGAAVLLLDSPPDPRGGDPVGIWRSTGSEFAVYLPASLRAVLSDIAVSAQVTGDVEFGTDGRYRADFILAVKMSVALSGLPLQWEGSDTTRAAGDYRVAANLLVLDGPSGVDSVAFSVEGDSLRLIAPIPLGAFSGLVAGISPGGGPLSVALFASAPSGRTADFDASGRVDFADFVAFARGFGARVGDGAFEARLDLDGNGEVGFLDFIAFARQFTG